MWKDSDANRGRKAARSAMRMIGGAVVVLVSVAGAGIAGLVANATASAAAAVAATSCTIVVPDNPLSAQGLATPYQFESAGGGTCQESDPNQSAFVQAAVLDPATGSISIYNPLVIDAGTQPAAKPVVPKLPAGAVVAIWFGSNGNVLQLARGSGRSGRRVTRPHSTFHLAGHSGVALSAGRCVNGLGNSDFGQVSYCNAPAFFAAANRDKAMGKLAIPALGTANDGEACPSTRDFSVVDQDPSDNVTASYLVLANGTTAQNTAANRAALTGFTILGNGSDEGLLAAHIDPALGCSPWVAPDLADPGAMVPALPLNELQAAADQQAPVALVPRNDEMVLVNGAPSLAKQNLYRVGVDQPRESSAAQAAADQKSFCQNIERIAPARLALDANQFSAAASPVAGFASLEDFLQNRYAFTISANGLNCAAVLG